MGTKASPGHFDCHAAALPDEPLFVLLARDPLASTLVRLWAAVRQGDRNIAFAAMMELQGFIPEYKRQPEREKAAEAFECASNMLRWRIENNGAWREPAVAPAAVGGA